MKTPFSGLSLIFHIAVIIIGIISDFFAKKKKRLSLVVKKEETILCVALKRIISVSIVTGLSTMMLIFFGIAIKTSVREGENEWHRKYTKEVWINLKDYSGEKLLGLEKFNVVSFFQSGKVAVINIYEQRNYLQDVN